ncbi:cyclic nucleotide-binding/CBS domain-containing protein [Ramlibacter sp.]|uniref:CBS domain-containing protein n=1 Tax=Ramlibacter sp. TaxID=1917967 RepID=UPI002C206833|nr:CBS domain-containing protein [Ramlibacter sp.]HWI84320.1 CBS domain-containing protein [Ramlibacter sp.]
MAERTVFQSMSHKHVVSLGPQASVYEAACIMTGGNCSSVLVTEPPTALVGIVTERDLMTRVLAKAKDPQTTRLVDIMTPNPLCVPPEKPVAEAVLIMLERGFRHLPVVGPGNKPLGVFSARDALPREIDNALNLAEFREQVNDALG